MKIELEKEREKNLFRCQCLSCPFSEVGNTIQDAEKKAKFHIEHKFYTMEENHTVLVSRSYVVKE